MMCGWGGVERRVDKRVDNGERKKKNTYNAVLLDNESARWSSECVVRSRSSKRSFAIMLKVERQDICASACD